MVFRYVLPHSECYFDWLYIVYLEANYTCHCVRNKASPSDNDWLKLLRTDWFENLLDKFTLKQIVVRAVKSKKIMVRSDWFQNLLRTLLSFGYILRSTII